MTIYKFTVKAKMNRFMESPLHETFTDLIIADNYDQACKSEREGFHSGWEIESMTCDIENVNVVRDCRF